MPFSFPNVSILGVTQNSRFLGAGFQYSNLQTLTVEGLCIDLTETQGISGVWSGAQGVLQTVQNQNNFQELILNGRSFGTGRVQSITYGPGDDVRTKTYRASLIVYQSGNLFNFTGTYYTGINTQGWQYLDQFSEDWRFDQKQNGGYDYTHGATIQFNSGVGNLNAITAAKTLARSLFTGSALGLAFYSGYTSKQGKRFFTESYNLINNSCDFRETFDFNNDNGAYSATQTNSWEISPEGVISVSENGQIQGIVNPTYLAAMAALGTQMTGCYYRCNQLFVAYSPPGSAPLQNTPATLGKTLDIFGNSLTYEVSFNNSPVNSGSFFWDYTQTVDRQNDIMRITENGTIRGRGENRTVAFEAAQAGRVQVVGNGIPVGQQGVFNRVTALYNQIGTTNPAFIETQSQSFSPYRGTVGYSYQFSNEAVLVGDNGVKRMNVEQNDQPPIYSYNTVNIVGAPGQGKQIAQNNQQSTLGAAQVSVSMLGEKSVPLSTYLTNAKTVLNGYIPVGTDPVIIDASYTFTPNQNAADATVGWAYSKAAPQTIVPQ